MASKCIACKKSIRNRHFLNCSQCNQTYHVLCTRVSEKRFYIMTEYHKNKWKCHVCYEKPKTTNSTPKIKATTSKLPLNSSDKPQNNVSELDKYVINVSTENSFDTLSSEDTDNSKDEQVQWSHDDDNSETERANMNRSCPDSSNRIAELEEMKNKNNDLEIKLQIAENEIDTLLSQNYTLKKQIEDYEKTIYNLTTICKSTHKATTPSNSSRRKNINRSRMCQTLSLPTTPAQRHNQHASTVPTPKKCVEESTPNKIILGDEQAPSNINTTSSPTSINGTRQDSINPVLNDIPDASTAPTPTECAEESSPNIIILGDEQASGLATKLIKSRQNKWNDKYKIFGFIKPEASSSEVLRNCNEIRENTNRNDYVVICTGNNDCNPNIIFKNVCLALSNLEKTNVLILPANNNINLNEKMINNQLKLLANTYDNCTYIDTHYLFNKETFVNLACQKINLHIDYSAYKKQFLTYRTFQTKNHDSNKPKKGTIPYYFPKLSKKNSKVNDHTTTIPPLQSINNQFFR